MVKRAINLGISILAAFLVLVGLLMIFLPGPAIIILPLGIYLFNKVQPGKIDPYLKGFMRFMTRAGRSLDKFFQRLNR